MKTLIDDLKAVGRIQVHEKKSFLFFAGDPADGFFYVQSGEPCCSGLYRIAEQAVEISGKSVSIKKLVIDIDGKMVSQ